MPQFHQWFSFGIASRQSYEATYYGGHPFADFDYDNVGVFSGTIPEGVPLSSPRPYYVGLRRDSCDDFMDGRIRAGWEEEGGIGGGITESGDVLYSDRQGNYAKQSLGLLFKPMSHEFAYGNTYDSTHLMRKIVGAGDFGAWGRVSARRLAGLQADADWWTAGLQFWFDTAYGGNRWHTRLEVGVAYDSAAGGRRLWFCVTRWNSGSGTAVSQYQYGPLLGDDDWPVEVGIQRVNSQSSPEFQMLYRICSSDGWGAWTEFTGFDPEDYWSYADLSESGVWVGFFGYTWGLYERKAVFDDFTYGPSVPEATGYWTTTGGVVEWEPIDSQNVRTRWAMDTFGSWEENEGDSDVEFSYAIMNSPEGEPSWSGWLTAEEIAEEESREGRLFYLKARFNASSDFMGTPKIWLMRLLYSLGPLIDFEASPTEADEPPLEVHFTPTFYTPVEGLEWDFGDESSPSSDFAPDHTYTESGIFSPSLMAWNEEGVTEYQKMELIQIGFPPPSPEVDFEASPTEGYAPLLVRFYDRSNKTMKQWLWDFGDDRTSDLANPTHVYVEEGSYDVSYTAWDLQGGYATEVKPGYIRLTERPEVPYPDFTWESSPPSDGGPPPYTVHFTDRSTGGPTGWEWDFGDEHSSDEQNPSHTYQDAGSYDVTLTVRNDNGENTCTWERAITVANVPANLNPDMSHGRSIWHMPAGQEYLSGNWHIVEGAKHAEFTMLRGGGCGPGRITLVADAAQSVGIDVGDSIAILHHKSSQPYEGDNALACWYLGCVDEIKDDLGEGAIDFILVGHARWLSDVYPGGNDDTDAPISYRSTAKYSQSYGPDPNDPAYLQLHYDMTECRISDVVEDLYARYVTPLRTPGGAAVFPVGPDIDQTPSSTDVGFLKLDGSQNLTDVFDTLAALAGNWTWGVDVEEYWENLTGVESIGYVYPRFFFKAPPTESEAAVQIGDRVKRRNEVESKKHLYNELVIEGGYKFNAMPYVVPMSYRFRHEGSIAQWGRRRLSVTVPQIKTRDDGESYANKFFSEYARPRTFSRLQQVGSNKRIAPFRRFVPFCSDPEEFEPRGGLLTLKDKAGGVVGIYDFDEARCVFNDCAIWSVSVGPRDPRLRAGATRAASGGTYIGRGSSAERPRKTQASITQQDMDYAPVFLGYGRVVRARYDPDLKDFLYDIAPTMDPTMTPAENSQIIEDAYNIYSTLIVPDSWYAHCARPIVADTQVAYYRGWNRADASPYYYVAEVTPRLTAFDIVFGEQGEAKSQHSHPIDIPEESCMYRPLKEYHSAPAVHLDSSGAWANDWNFWVEWDYDTPRMFINGYTKDGLPHPTYFALHVWVQIVSVKRSDI